MSLESATYIPTPTIEGPFFADVSVVQTEHSFTPGWFSKENAQLQRFLVKFGYLASETGGDVVQSTEGPPSADKEAASSVDGWFGAATAKALREFQDFTGLLPDSIAGVIVAELSDW